MHLEYLTVQDVLWINFQVTRKLQRFSYATLEEAVFYQYAYGESNILVPQAARLLRGFLKLAPFSVGNEATALVATLAFLVLNGRDLTLQDSQALEWFEDVRSGKTNAIQAIESATRESHGGHHGEPSVQQTMQQVLSRFPNTIAKLGNPAVAA
jgi:prophage maintenance system killer protein